MRGRNPRQRLDPMDSIGIMEGGLAVFINNNILTSILCVQVYCVALECGLRVAEPQTSFYMLNMISK